MVAQARSNDALERIAHLGLFPPYREKPQAGLHITGRAGAPLFSAVAAGARLRALRGHPAGAGRVAAVHREPRAARRGHAAPQPGGGMGPPRARARGRATGSGGAAAAARSPRRSRSSATRPRASPTRRARSCARCSRRACAPIATASVTMAARRQIVVDYLNGVPLSAVPGGGEVIGLGDGLAAWYGASFDGREPAAHAAARARRRRPRRRSRAPTCSRSRCSSRSGARPRCCSSIPTSCSRRRARTCRCSRAPA